VLQLPCSYRPFPLTTSPKYRKIFNKALAALEHANPESLQGVVEHIDFNRQVGSSRIPDKKLRYLIAHFSRYRLRTEVFEFPDLLGAAYRPSNGGSRP